MLRKFVQLAACALGVMSGQVQALLAARMDASTAQQAREQMAAPALSYLRAIS